MAINYPGEFEVRINYTTLGRKHQVRFSFDANVTGAIGEDFTNWIPIQKNGSAVATLDTHVDALAALLQDYYTSSGSIDDAELWKYAPLSFDAVWQSSYPIGLTGTGAGSLVAAAEYIMVFRTSAGGTMRFTLLEGTIAFGVRDTLPLSYAPLDEIADFILAPASIMRGRDSGVPVVLTGGFSGQNESVFKKVYRQD